MEINVLLALMFIVSFLVAISLHEWSHATMATWLGDRTARSAGRQTLSLRSHVDPVGLMLAIILSFQVVLLSPVALGWGKPVKPDPWKLRGGPDRGLLIVTVTGILFSLVVGLLSAVLAGVVTPFLVQNIITIHILQFLVVFAVTNVALAIFNLLPFYPLDMYQIVYTLLPNKQAVSFSRTAAYGPFIILAIFFLLPLVGELANSSFPLFHLAGYIRELAGYVVNPLMGGSIQTTIGPISIVDFYLFLLR